MYNIYQKKIILFLFLSLNSGILFAQNQMVISTNIPEIQSYNITIGMEQATISFSTQEVDSLKLSVVVPVDNSTFSLIDPNGNIIVDHNTVIFYSGLNYSPPLPGGIFSTDEIFNPAEGIWSIQINFPPAIEKTAIQATISKKSRYQTGLALARNHFNTGEDAPIGVIILDNGIPITNLTPSFTIVKDGVIVSSNLVGQDNGIDADGLANDGIYSIRYVFSESGKYNIINSVDIPMGNGTLTKTSTAYVQVSDPGILLNSIETLTRDNGGCIESLIARINIDINNSSIFNVEAILRSQNGNTLESSSQLPSTVGSNFDFDLEFFVKDIRDSIGSGPYELISLKIVEFSQTPRLSFVSKEIRPFNGVTISNFCSPPLVVSETLTEEPIISSNGLISGINIDFTITVQVEGIYQISYKIVDPNGIEIGLFTFSQHLNIGENIFRTTVDASYFADIDGPYDIISLLVLGPAGSYQSSFVGTTRFYSGDAFIGSSASLIITPIPTLTFWSLTLLLFLIALLGKCKLRN